MVEVKARDIESRNTQCVLHTVCTQGISLDRLRCNIICTFSEFVGTSKLQWNFWNSKALWSDFNERSVRKYTECRQTKAWTLSILSTGFLSIGLMLDPLDPMLTNANLRCWLRDSRVTLIEFPSSRPKRFGAQSLLTFSISLFKFFCFYLTKMLTLICLLFVRTLSSPADIDLRHSAVRGAKMVHSEWMASFAAEDPSRWRR